MKITSFYPFIVTVKLDEVMGQFEALGFERAHEKDGINGNFKDVVMKNQDGFKVDVLSVDKIADSDSDAILGIRMNVDDFDEAYKFLTDRGFKNLQGDKVSDTGTSKATLMVSPSGFFFDLAEHIK